MAGHEVRLIDIEADSQTYGVFDDLQGCANGAAFADAIQTAVDHHHGAAGHAFVQKLIASGLSGKWGELAQIIRNKSGSWVAKLPSAADGQIQRVAQRFALIGVAGWLATRFGLTGWDENEALEAAERAFIDWYDRRYDDRREAVGTFVETLRDYLSKALTSLPMVTGPHVPGATPDGWRDASRVYLTPEAWAQVFPGADGTAAAKAFHAMEMLLAGETGRLTRKAPRAILGKRQRLYTLNIDRVNEFSPD